MRTLIFHHHLFKTAGTSVEIALRQAFPGRWAALEGEGGQDATAQDLARLLEARPELVAVSSHTFRPPFDAVPGLRLLPIVFLRHPLDRVRSAYEFERVQVSDSYGAKLAKGTDFAGYVRQRLAQPGDRSIRNYQTYRLGKREGLPNRAEDQQFLNALATLTCLPFVGLVESFAFSLARFERIIAAEFGPVALSPTHANAAPNGEGGGQGTLAERVAAAEARLGPELAAEFWAANRHDLQLHELVGWTQAQMRAG